MVFNLFYIDTFHYVLVWASIANCHRLSAHKQQKVILQSSGGWKSVIRVAAWMNSRESSLPGCRLMNSPNILVGGRQKEATSSLLVLRRALTPFRRAPPSWPHLIPTTSHRVLLLITSHGGIGFHHMNFWWHNSS